MGELLGRAPDAAARGRRRCCNAFSIPRITTWRPAKRLASPRVFLGVSRGDLDDSLRMLHDHLRRIMTPLPANFPWIEYDIWGTEAKGVEEAMRAEIPVAAKLGVELFMLDAGWYEGSAKDGSGDWFAGVGNYGREDRVKFPAGLADLSRRVHAAGMKFGLWFAPQVVDSSLVGTVIPRDFVARRDGRDMTLQDRQLAGDHANLHRQSPRRRAPQESHGRLRRALPTRLAQVGQLGPARPGVQRPAPRPSIQRRGPGGTERPIRNLAIPPPAFPQADAGRVRLPQPAGLRPGAVCHFALALGRHVAVVAGAAGPDPRQLRLSPAEYMAFIVRGRGRRRRGRPAGIPSSAAA